MNSKFEEVHRMLQFRGRLVGLQCLYPGLNLWKDKKWIVFTAVVLQAILFYSTFDIIFYSRRFCNKEGLIKLLSNFMSVFLQAVSSYIVTHYWLNREEYGEILCNLEAINSSEKSCLVPIYKKHLEIACKRSKMAQRFISTLDLFAFINYMVVGCGFVWFIDGTTTPLPTFYELSFMSVNGWGTYIVNLLQQAIFAGKTILNWQMYGCTFFHFAMFMVAKFDATTEIIDSLKTVEEDLGFDEWLKHICESFDIIRESLGNYSDLETTAFYMQEKTSYFIILASWIVWHIDPSMIGTSMAGFSFFSAVALIVVLNEIFLDKFDDLNEALYGLPWYEMDLKHRKNLLILIQSTQNPISLSSGGINNLTLEWLGGVVNGAYGAAVSVQGLMDM